MNSNNEVAGRDQEEGPQFRVRQLLITETYSPESQVWRELRLHPETQWTVVRRGQVYDLMINQPTVGLNDVIRQALVSLAQTLIRVLTKGTL